MPISLILAELNRTRPAVLTLLADWSRWLALDELLVARARGAFLVHWFGPVLPMTGTALTVFITNLDELRAQYEYVLGQVEGISLAEPLAGYLGSLVGALSVPFHSIFLMAWVDRYCQTAASGLMMVANVLTLGLAVSAGTLLAAPLLPIFASTHSARELLGGFHQLLIAVARLVSAGQRFWELVSGPRERVLHPIVAAALRLGDRLSVLLPQVIGMLAFLLVRVGPELGRLARELPPLANLLESLVAALKLVWKDFISALTGAFSGERWLLAPLIRAGGLLLRVPGRIKQGFLDVFQALKRGLLAGRAKAGKVWSEWAGRFSKALANTMASLPLVGVFVARREAVEIAISRLGGGSSGPGIPWASIARGYRRVQGAVPVLPPLPTSPLPSEAQVRAATGPEPVVPLGLIPELRRELSELRRRGLVPDLEALMRGELAAGPGPRPAIFDLPADVARALERPEALPSVFSAERARLRRELGRSPEEELRARREEQLRYLDLLGNIIDRMLPASSAGHFAQLESLLADVDRTLRLPTRPRRVPYPVLELREERRMRLEVGRFTLQVRSAARGDERTRLEGAAASFGRRLRALWIGQEYLQPAPAT